jgi:dethiobiotin synthetase
MAAPRVHLARPNVLFVTGTDTGVGKTVLAVLLVRSLVDGGVPVAALKPVCSGGRDDARRLHQALGGALALDTINPWHFKAPVAPDLAARRERRQLRLRQVLNHVRAHRPAGGLMVIEGAGGLLSPLGCDFDSRDLILRLRAIPIVVCPNRLGAVNQVRLVLNALPPARTAETRVVLVQPDRLDAATPANARSLARFLPPDRILVLPRVQIAARNRADLSPKVRQVLDRLLIPFV